MSRHALWAAATAGILANGVRLRSRIRQFPVLDELPSGFGDDFEVVTAEGVTVDEATLRAAIGYARRHDLDVVDLIPGDLPVTSLLELVRSVNPKAYRNDALAAGRTAGHASLVRSTLVPRVRLPRTAGLDPVEYVAAMLQLKRFAPTTTDLVIAPHLTAVTPDVAWRMPRLRATVHAIDPDVAACLVIGFAVAPAVTGAALLAGPKASRVWGTTALAAHAAQPFIATAGTSLEPKDLEPHTALGRAGRDVVGLVRAVCAKTPERIEAGKRQASEEAEAARDLYEAMMEDPGTFFEPRRLTCPWCGSDQVQRMLEVADLLQGKPGTFTLDECRSCGHIFQNPRLSIEGLDFYYKDFYDGLGADGAEFAFSMGGVSYKERAMMLDGVAQPKRWLDVGGGHGHFCLYARAHWPETQFEALDLGDGVVEAERRGWVKQGHKGLFPDLADDLMGAYDVVSMYHYLEHTREPEAELDAACTVLEGGGHLLIEVPDPDSRLGRKLGGLWGPWFQPQHQHFVSLGNLTAALRQRGFTILSAERAEAHQPVDFASALWLLANKVAPAGDQPWSRPPTAARKVGRMATFVAFAPAIAAAILADQALAPVLRRTSLMTNAYRVLARKN